MTCTSAIRIRKAPDFVRVHEVVLLPWHSVPIVSL